MLKRDVYGLVHSPVGDPDCKILTQEEEGAVVLTQAIPYACDMLSALSVCSLGLSVH